MSFFLRWRSSILAGLFAISVSIIGFQSWRNSRNLQIETARTAARAYAAALTKYRDFYIQEVMKEAKAAGIELPYPSHGKDGALPLAYEFAIDLGDKLATETVNGARYRIFSDYPWPERKNGGVQNAFERKALDALLLGKTEHWDVKENDNGRTLLYSEPIILKSFCADCHNQHPASPRRDWKEGDVRGVLSVELPLPEPAVLPSNAEIDGTGILLLLTSTLLGALLFVVSKYSKLTAARQRDSELALILQSIAEPILVVDREGLILEANQATSDVLGWHNSELVGQSARKLLPNEQAWASPRIVAAEAVSRQGKTFAFTLRVTALHGPEERWVLSLRDESGLLDVQRRLLEAQKWETVGAVCGGIAHDFNNLMSVIVNHAELLIERNTTTNEDRPCIEQVRKSALSAADLTKQLLAYGRKQALVPEIVNVNEFLSERMSIFSKLGTKHRVSLQVSSMTSTVCVDRRQLELALLNLIFNARDASPDGSEIVLSTADSGATGMVAFEVGDCGPGIPKELRTRALEPFFSTKHGSGLGLSSVLGFAQQSGGNVEIDSTQAGGALIRLLLPACSPKDTANETPPSLEERAPRQRSVLLVDDNDMVRRSFAAQLRTLQCSVQEACGVSEAVALLERSPGFDVYILDVRLGPEETGLQIAEAARRINGRAPTIFLSGYLEPRELDEILKDDCYAFLNKPVSRRELAETLERICHPRNFN